MYILFDQLHIKVPKGQRRQYHAAEKAIATALVDKTDHRDRRESIRRALESIGYPVSYLTFATWFYRSLGYPGPNCPKCPKTIRCTCCTE